MTFVPHSDAERKAMLEMVGVERLEDLFAGLPQHMRFPLLDLPAAISEIELVRELRTLADRNIAARDHVSFRGGGSYHHFRPAIVDHVLQRAEFHTAYTPYQPEISQGLLQAMFEYQTLICQLTGMEISNASHYDGATALAEAVLMALAADGKRTKIVVSQAVHPHYRAVLETYLAGTNARLAEVSEVATAEVDTDTAALVVQSPNVFGQIEDLGECAARCRDAGAHLIVSTDPIALGLLDPPGTFGADIVVADGQCLGLSPCYGGPSLGIFATRREHVRRLPGRLVGQTTDADGRRGYVLTLGTREQHIRRQRATSNICTNAALGALAASVYLAVMGKHGLRRVAELCYHRAHYAAGEIAQLPGCSINPQAPDKTFFKEFVARLPRPVADVNERLRVEHGIIGGLDLGTLMPGRSHDALIAVTEATGRADIDRLVAGLRTAFA